MTELQAFLAMLDRAGIGHGLRHDHYPKGAAVQVEHPDDEGDGGHVTDWAFDAAGRLVEVSHYVGKES